MTQGWMVLAACLLVGWGPVRDGSDRVMVGDWAPADAFLVGHHSLWKTTTDRVLRELESSRVMVVSPEDDMHESVWVRDYGPIAVSQGDSVLWLDTEYHPGRSVDDALPGSLGRELGVRVEHTPLRLEGGGVSSDGRGLCVMTEKSRRAVPTNETVLEQLGCRGLAVIPRLPGEPTGHVDLALQFLSPDVVAVAELHGDDISANEAARLDRTAADLVAAARSAGRHLRVLRLPVFRDRQGRYFSYVNFVSLPERILVPDFSVVPDGVQTKAYQRLRSESGKQIVTIPADQLALSGGGLHCIVLGLHSTSIDLSPGRS